MEKPEHKMLLTCPVCHDIFKEPRQLPCGHSFCMVCLEGMIDVSSDMPFRCPDCRMYFGTVIGVQKNYALASIAEDYRQSQEHKTKQEEQVYCDCCPGKVSPAMKTCLKCEVSLCQLHIKDHMELTAFTGHPLVKPLADLKDRKCPEHNDEVLRYYCTTSRRYICNICALENKQTNLATETASILGRKLTEYMEQRFHSMEGTVKDCRDSMKKLKGEIQKERQNMNPNDSWLNSVTVVLLCLWFIVLYYAYCYSVENHTLRETQETQQARLHHIYSAVAEFLVDFPAASLRSADIEGLSSLSLDMDTASPFLRLSADLQSAQRDKTKLSLPSIPLRFDEAPQVLSTKCYADGTHSWEVEAEGYWDIALSYKSIQRKGKDNTAFGTNAQSWSLTHKEKGQLFAYHNKTKKVLASTLNHNRIRVTVNFGKGTISFLEVGLQVSLLHEFQAKLTEPVCLGFGLYRVDPPSRASIIQAS